MSYRPCTTKATRDDVLFHLRSMGKLSTEAHLNEIFTDLANAEREIAELREFAKELSDRSCETLSDVHKASNCSRCLAEDYLARLPAPPAEAEGS